MTEYNQLQISHGHWRISVLDECLVRFEWSPSGSFEDRPTQVITQRPFSPTDAQVRQDGDGVQIITAAFQLDYDGRPPSPSSLKVKGRANYHAEWRYGLPFPDLFGEVLAMPTNLGGTARTLDGADGPIPLDDGLVSRNGISMLDDSSSMIVDGNQLIAREPGAIDVYVFTHGTDHAGAINDFYRISGTPPLIPRWAFGNWWSRYHAYSQDEYEALMDRFDAQGLPFSVAVIDMDWHLTDIDPKYGHGWTGYTWNRELFPNPQGFLAGLHERGLHVTLNVHPADGVRAYEDSYQQIAEALGRDSSTQLPVEFALDDPSFATAYFEQIHHPLEDMGVDFWWVDWQQGTVDAQGVDPLWRLNYLHTRDMTERGKRPLILSRFAGPGSHRFPIGFSGDAVATWASLDFQPQFTAAAANIGYGMWSHDIGGHIFGAHDDEMATRWVQFGVFSPFNRLHSSDDPFAGKEPWNFGPVAAQIMGRYLRLRHGLVPYLYTEWASGRPLVRPLYHRWGDNPDSYEIPNEYLLGDSLIVAPVTTPISRDSQTAATRVWLPHGVWADLGNGLVYQGDRFITLHRDLAHIPVLATSGSVIPLADDASTDNPEQLTVMVVPGDSGSYQLVEDDGALSPATATTTLSWDHEAQTLSISAADGASGVLPERRHWRVCFVGGQIGDGADQADRSDAPVASLGDGQINGLANGLPDELTDIPGAAVFDLGWADSAQGLVWHAPHQIDLGSNQVKQRVHELLVTAQTALRNKTEITRIVDHGTPLDQLVALHECRVHGAETGKVLPLPDELIEAVSEIIVARPDETEAHA